MPFRPRLVGALIAVLVTVQGNAEAAFADFAGALPIGFAAAAGLVASVNPCGFFMLPSYIAYQLGTEEAGYNEIAAPLRVVRALGVAITATLGFVLIFVAFGAVVSAGGSALGQVFPYLGLAIGLAMVGFGAFLLVSHRYVGILAASRIQVTPQRNIGNAFVFGIAYAVGSLSCTLPIFMVVVGGSLATEGFFESLSQYVAYSLGMGVVIVGRDAGRGAVPRRDLALAARRAAARTPRQLVLHVGRRRLPHLVLAGLRGHFRRVPLVERWAYAQGWLPSTSAPGAAITSESKLNPEHVKKLPASSEGTASGASTASALRSVIPGLIRNPDPG